MRFTFYVYNLFTHTNKLIVSISFYSKEDNISRTSNNAVQIFSYTILLHIMLHCLNDLHQYQLREINYDRIFLY